MKIGGECQAGADYGYRSGNVFGRLALTYEMRLKAQSTWAAAQRVSSDCEITGVSAIVGMKLVSPFQRGTMCQWRWPGRPAPATRPRLRPTLKPSGFISCSSRPTQRVIV